MYIKTTLQFQILLNSSTNHSYDYEFCPFCQASRSILQLQKHPFLVLVVLVETKEEMLNYSTYSLWHFLIKLVVIWITKPPTHTVFRKNFWNEALHFDKCSPWTWVVFLPLEMLQTRDMFFIFLIFIFQYFNQITLTWTRSSCNNLHRQANHKKHTHK